MVFQQLHAAAKAGFLAFTDWRRGTVSPRRRQLQQLFLREVNSWSTWVDMPLSDRLRYWREGFLSKSAYLYDFDTYDRDDFLTDLQREQTATIHEPDFIDVISNKVGFHFAMEPFSEHRPETYGVVTGGQFHPLESVVSVGDGGNQANSDSNANAVRMGSGDERGGQASHERADDTGAQDEALPSGLSMTARDLDGLETAGTREAGAWVLDHLDWAGELILKPADLAGGAGIRHYTCDEDGYRVNGRRTTPDAIARECATLDGYVAMECIKQAKYANELFDGSVNTIRMITMYDEEEGEAFCPAVIHRIGTERSSPVDNFSQGGISAAINLETGELSEAVRLTESGEVEWYATHPTTDATIEGRVVPEWPTIRDKVLAIATSFSYLPYVGWDVIVTGDGEFVILEVNSCPDMDLMQVHRPLLADKRARAFFASHGLDVS